MYEVFPIDLSNQSSPENGKPWCIYLNTAEFWNCKKISTAINLLYLINAYAVKPAMLSTVWNNYVVNNLYCSVDDCTYVYYRRYFRANHQRLPHQHLLFKTCLLPVWKSRVCASVVSTSAEQQVKWTFRWFILHLRLLSSRCHLPFLSSRACVVSNRPTCGVMSVHAIVQQWVDCVSCMPVTGFMFRSEREAIDYKSPMHVLSYLSSW